MQIFRKLGCVVLALFLSIGSFSAVSNVKTHESVVDIAEVSTQSSYVVQEGELAKTIAKQIVKEQNKHKKSDKKAVCVLLLNFFGGVLGLHRFYVGKIGTGILWLCTGGILGIGAFIDFINIVCENFKDSKGRTIKF